MICGIDEAGRGCIAGDLCIAGVVLNSSITGLNDSKKLSQKRREILYDEIIKNSSYKIVIFSSSDVDNFGLSECLRRGLSEIYNYFLAKFSEVEFIYDGNTNFGVGEISTMVKADAIVAEVSAASILAKVTRDNNIFKLDKIYPQYSLAKNKGYLTKAHIKAIKEFGLSKIHRHSYKIKSLQKNLFD